MPTQHSWPPSNRTRPRLLSDRHFRRVDGQVRITLTRPHSRRWPPLRARGPQVGLQAKAKSPWPTSRSAAPPPIAGANIKNFHGYDLTAFAGSPDLGNAEQVVTNYVSNPQYRQQLDQKLATEYGYQTNWWKNIPQVNTVMLYAAQHLDPTAAGATNTFQSLLANTQWWKTTTSNGRYWDEAYGTNGAPGTDPAQANQAIQNAQEKVLADANQIGVQLSKQELDAIALAYAKNN